MKRAIRQQFNQEAMEFELDDDPDNMILVDSEVRSIFDYIVNHEEIDVEITTQKQCTDDLTRLFVQNRKQ